MGYFLETNLKREKILPRKKTAEGKEHLEPHPLKGLCPQGLRHTLSNEFPLPQEKSLQI